MYIVVGTYMSVRKACPPSLKELMFSPFSNTIYFTPHTHKVCLPFCPPQPFENSSSFLFYIFTFFLILFPYSPKSHPLTFFLLPLEGRGLHSTVFTPEQLSVQFVKTTPKISRRVPSVIYTGTLRLRHNCELG
jgi:hypothetical protein